MEGGEKLRCDRNSGRLHCEIRDFDNLVLLQGWFGVAGVGCVNLCDASVGDVVVCESI